MTMYESPISLQITEKTREIVGKVDNAIFRAVCDVLPVVDQKELIRALQYDRGQYDKGYADGYAEGKADAAKWIPVTQPPKEYRDEYGELIPFLVCEDGTEYPFRAMYDGKTWGDGFYAIPVTHWMPLPEPPKGE